MSKQPEPIYVEGTSVMHVLRARWHYFTCRDGITRARGSTFCGLRTTDSTLWRVIPNDLALTPPIALCRTCARHAGIEIEG